MPATLSPVPKNGLWLTSTVTGPLALACAQSLADVEVTSPAATPRSKVADAGVTPTPTRTRDATTRVGARPRRKTPPATTCRIISVTSGPRMLVDFTSRRQGKKLQDNR